MKITKCFEMALHSILGNKVRSFLTMLGIIIGIAAVIILVSVMNGMTGEITSAFDDIGTNQISVMIQGRGGNRSIEPEDMYEFVEKNNDYFEACSPTVTVQGSVKIGNETLDATKVTGVGEDYSEMSDMTLTSGRFLQYIDVKERKKVCVIGSYISNTYFRGQAVGKSIKINGNPYTVVGVIKEEADSTEGSTDDCIYLPYTNAAKMMFGAINNYTFSILEEEQYAACEGLLEQRLNQTFENDDYYQIISMKEVADMVTELLDTMTMVLVCIAGISLLVGGIGIMNIMLVTVTERTKEIGIRKSLGAKHKDIMSQFVIEAATVSLIGGVIGIILGCIVSSLFGKLLGLTVAPSLFAVLVATGVSVGIGIGFGYLPASKAAKMNPIDALRHD